MLSKNQVKHIRSLHSGKFREIHSQYLVEGEKMLQELLKSEQNILHVYALYEWIDKHSSLLSNKNIDFTEISESELINISTLTTPNKVVAVVGIHKNEISLELPLEKGLYLALENIQDPGNLGTIIRSAEWFGVKRIFCSLNTVGIYNSKVVQASMGSVFRMPVQYLDLEKLIRQQNTFDTYAAILGGDNIYETTLNSNSIIIIGNESKGISNNLQAICKHKITIPNFGDAESLNAAVACSIILALAKR